LDLLRLAKIAGTVLSNSPGGNDIKYITDKMLTTQLRELEAEGFIKRKVYPIVPTKVEYSITEKGRTCIPVIKTIREYGLLLMAEAGVNNK